MKKQSRNQKQTLGAWGEQVAAKFLEEQGYTILERNLRTPYGEIDLVAHSGSELVFVEVKTRSSERFGHPEEAVTETKAVHMIESAEAFLLENPETHQDWRIDVISILRKPGEAPEILHFENAV